MTDPVIRAEAAHVARRDGRAALAIEEWPYQERQLHREQSVLAIERAVARVWVALDRTRSP